MHRYLGPGLLESTYGKCLAYELDVAGIYFATQAPLSVEYKGATIDCGYRLDFLIEDYLVVELKAVEQLLPTHQAQVIGGTSHQLQRQASQRWHSTPIPFPLTALAALFVNSFVDYCGNTTSTADNQHARPLPISSK